MKSKSTLFKILTDYDNDDKRAQNRKINKEQSKVETKTDERSERYSQNINQNYNGSSNQQRKPWHTKNINAIQRQNKSKASNQNTE